MAFIPGDNAPVPAGKTGRLGAIDGRDFERLVGAQGRVRQP